MFCFRLLAVCNKLFAVNLGPHKLWIKNTNMLLESKFGNFNWRWERKCSYFWWEGHVLRVVEYVGAYKQYRFDADGV